MATPLDTYRQKLGPLAVWEAFPDYGGVHDDVRAALAAQGDPKKTTQAVLAFAADAAMLAWKALPQEFRADMTRALTDLASELAEGLSEAGAEIASKLGNAIEVIPVIGALIKVVLDIVVQVEKYTKENDRITSDFSYNYSLYRTVEAYARPDQWVAQQMSVRNYLRMSDPHVASLFRLVPCMRQSEEMDRIWFNSAGGKDRGWCGDGISVRCPTFMDADDGEKTYWNCDVVVKKDEGNVCHRTTGISCLFFPWWRTAYAPGPSPLRASVGSPEPAYDVNTLVAARQLALISQPAANLVARASTVRNVAERVIETFWAQAEKGDGFVVRDLHNGNFVGSESLPLDENKRGDHAAPGFYRRPDGIIESYTGDDLTKWGIEPPWAGPPSQPDLGISIAAYNAVVSGMAAFFRGRSEILRNGPVLREMFKRISADSLDPEVKAAAEWSADQGKIQPPIAPQLKANLIATLAKPQRMTRAPGRMGPEGGGGGALLALGVAGAVAYFLTRGRR